MAVKSSFVLMRSPSFSNFKCNLFASRNSSNPCFLSHVDASIFSFWPKSIVYTALGSARADSISPMIMAIPSIAAHRQFLEFVFTPSVPYRLLVMTSTEKHISLCICKGSCRQFTFRFPNSCHAIEHFIYRRLSCFLWVVNAGRKRELTRHGNRRG